MDTPHESSSSLRIAVLGMGNIGSTFAFQLARVGHHDVTGIARPGSVRFGQLQRDGGVVNAEDERAEMRVVDGLEETIPYDLVIVTLPVQHTDAVLPALKRSAAKWIQFMANSFEPDRLRDAVGAERCSFGMPFVQALIDGEGRLKAKIGSMGQKSLMNHEGWVKVFREAGMPAAFEPEMLLWLRCHAPLCVAFESASVAGVRRGRGASWGEATVLARGLQESFTMIQRMGYRLYPAGKARLSRGPAWMAAGMLWGMSRVRSFRELLATGAAECNALLEVLVAKAATLEPPVSVARIEAMKP